jgi:hypothetical protein
MSGLAEFTCTLLEQLQNPPGSPWETLIHYLQLIVCCDANHFTIDSCGHTNA